MTAMIDTKTRAANYARIAYFSAEKIFILRDNPGILKHLPNPGVQNQIKKWTEDISDDANAILEKIGYRYNNGVFVPLPWPPISYLISINYLPVTRFLTSSKAAYFCGEALSAIQDDGTLTSEQIDFVVNKGGSILDASEKLVKLLDDPGGAGPGDDPMPITITEP